MNSAIDECLKYIAEQMSRLAEAVEVLAGTHPEPVEFIGDDSEGGDVEKTPPPQ